MKSFLDEKKIIKPLRLSTYSNSVGKVDNSGCWYPYENFMVPGSFDVREPSRKYPFSFLSHARTKKYALLLFNHKPSLYLFLQNIPVVRVGITKQEALKLIIHETAKRRLGK